MTDENQNPWPDGTGSPEYDASNPILFKKITTPVGTVIEKYRLGAPTMTHSPEPWRFGVTRIAYEDYPCLLDQHGERIDQIENPNREDGSAVNWYKADIKRIVACVNAMQGIKDPKAFMETIATAIRYLGRAEHDMLFATESLLLHLRAAADIANVFEEYT
jgi:hypothetical protein